MGANCSGSLIRKKQCSVYYELFTKKCWFICSKCWFICSKKGNTLVIQAIFFHFVVLFSNISTFNFNKHFRNYKFSILIDAL